jgi:hypothetical protein
MSSTYEELKKLNTKRTNDPIKKFSKEQIQMANKHNMKNVQHP